MIDMVKIGRFISRCRKEKGLTQAQLAEKFGITDRAVSKWETGKSLPDASIMLELCDLLGINVNELLSGEKLDMKNYNEKAEKNILALKEREEKANKNMLMMEVVIGISSTTAFISLLLFGILVPGLSQTWRIVPCVVGTVIFAASMHMCMIIEQTAGFYKCPHCNHTFIPTLKQTYFAQHIGRTRKLRCPHCRKKGWCKKTLTEHSDPTINN